MVALRATTTGGMLVGMDPLEALSQPADKEPQDTAPAVASWLRKPEREQHKQTLAEKLAAEPEWVGHDD